MYVVRVLIDLLCVRWSADKHQHKHFSLGSFPHMGVSSCCPLVVLFVFFWPHFPWRPTKQESNPGSSLHSFGRHQFVLSPHKPSSRPPLPFTITLTSTPITRPITTSRRYRGVRVSKCPLPHSSTLMLSPALSPPPRCSTTINFW